MASSDCYTIPWLLGAMDRLWFHKIVLCSESICSNKNPVAITSPSSLSSSSSSESQPSNSSSARTDYSDDGTIEEFSHGAHGLLPTTSTSPQNDSEDEDDKKEMLEEEENTKEVTPTRPNQVMTKTKTSSTPTPRRCIKSRLRLERTSSCKTLSELEQEEVKGFMDLGFIFDKDRLTPRMMSVIPGLQRLGDQDENDGADENGYEEEREEQMEMIGRGKEARRQPYLSEAWLIKRPESPLLRLRMSRVSTTSSDMKKHLKLWAKTVANSAIQQH